MPNNQPKIDRVLGILHKVRCHDSSSLRLGRSSAHGVPNVRATANQKLNNILAAVTSGLLTIVSTGIAIVSYFGIVTAFLFGVTIVRKFTPR